ncbi:MAG: hypothetical protein HY869_21130 [Chloroflexi bacterium]|nr:hypothetical protein [Chloroflexota bacterium]
MNKTANTPNSKPGVLSYFFDHVFFDETIAIRLIRFMFMLLVILGWAFLATLWFEQASNWQEILRAMSRHLLAPFSAMLAAFLIGARYLQDIYELPGYLAAVHYLYASLFDGPPYLPPFSGLFLPNMNISDGKVDSESTATSLLDQVGGPGWISVGNGNAVLLESLEETGVVVGAGTHYVPRNQRVQEIVSLEDQVWVSKPVVATTKDGIEIAVRDFQFGYRICADHRAGSLIHRTAAEPYPFSAQAVRDMAYNRSVRVDGKPLPWSIAVQFRLDGILTDFINSNVVDEVIAPVSADPRKIMHQQLSDEKLRGGIKNFLGTEVIWFNVGQFTVQDEKIDGDIKRYRKDVWFAHWAGNTAMLLAQGKAEIISEEEGGRSQTTVSMLGGIVQALKDAGLDNEKIDENLWNIVLARTAQVIESMTSLYGKWDTTERDQGMGKDKHES